MHKHALTLTLCAAALGWGGPAAAYPIAFPARASSLADGEYFSTNGHGDSYVPKGGSTWALDITVRSFIDGAWSEYVDGATSPYSLAEDLSYGTPLYAAADGVVVACWRDQPDSPDPEVNPCDGGCPTGQTIGGNHLIVVVPDESHAIQYLHLAAGTIPDELCPIFDADGVIDDMGKASCSDGGTAPRNSTRLDAFLAPEDLPVVMKGDYIGDMGHSGNSWNPHLHLQVNSFAYDDQDDPCQGDSVQIEFVEAWQQPRDAGNDASVDAWAPLDQAPLPVTATSGMFVMWPEAVGARKLDLPLGAGDSIDVETDVQGGMVAYRNSDDELRLTSFHIGVGGAVPDDRGDLTAQATRNEGVVQALDLVKLPVNERDYVLAIRGSNGNLKVIPYRADYTTGAIVRQPGDREDGAIRALAAAPSPSHSGVVVAVRDDHDTLKVIDYVAAAGTLAISRPGSSAGSGATEIVDVAITATRGAFKGVVTAERSPFFNDVTLRSFEVTAAASVIARDSEAGPAAIAEVELATVDGLFPGVTAVALAMRDSNDDLRVQTWTVANTGALTLADDRSAGAIEAVDVVAVKGRDLVTGLREGDDQLSLVSWSTDWAGDQLRRAGTRKAGDVLEVDLASYHGTPAVTVHPRYKHLLTGVRTSTGDLKVISNAVNYASAY